LLVEREVSHIDLARGFEDGGWRPDHLARVMKHRFCHRGDDVLSISAETERQHVSAINAGRGSGAF